MTDSEAKDITNTIRSTSFDLHAFLRSGHFEKVYENGLAHRLQRIGFSVRQQFPIKVHDIDGFLLGDYIADLIIDTEIIVEVKACESLIDAHIAQVLGYLRATGLRHGVLINFGAPTLQIKKLVL